MLWDKQMSTIRTSQPDAWAAVEQSELEPITRIDKTSPLHDQGNFWSRLRSRRYHSCRHKLADERASVIGVHKTNPADRAVSAKRSIWTRTREGWHSAGEMSINRVIPHDDATRYRRNSHAAEF
jgi:hypothetical protein